MSGRNKPILPNTNHIQIIASDIPNDIIIWLAGISELDKLLICQVLHKRNNIISRVFQHQNIHHIIYIRLNTQKMSREKFISLTIIIC